jgi:hypothetical protein
MGYDYTTLSIPSVAGGAFRVAFETAGCLGHWRLRRIARFVDGVLELDRPVKEYFPLTYRTLYAVRVAEVDYLVPAAGVEQFQNGLSEDGQRVVNPIAVDMYAFRRGRRAMAAGLSQPTGFREEPSGRPADARDCEVIETALHDLLDYHGKGTPLPAGQRDRILFARIGPRSGPSRADIMEAFNPRRGVNLSRAEQGTLGDLIASISRRGTQRGMFAAFTPHDKRIEVREQSAPAGWTSNEGRAVTASLPGYSRPGDAALAWLVIPWGHHHAEGFYLLTRQGRNWKVARRSFLYYP